MPSSLCSTELLNDTLLEYCFFFILFFYEAFLNYTFQNLLYKLSFTDNSPASKVTDEDIGQRFENLTGRKATSMQNSDVIISC